MSYSFNVKTGTKGQARVQAEEELKKVLIAQPLHNKDHNQTLAAVHAFVDTLGEDNTKDVNVSVNGNVAQDGDGKITNVSINVQASLVARP